MSSHLRSEPIEAPALRSVTFSLKDDKEGVYEWIDSVNIKGNWHNPMSNEKNRNAI